MSNRMRFWPKPTSEMDLYIVAVTEFAVSHLYRASLKIVHDDPIWYAL